MKTTKEQLLNQLRDMRNATSGSKKLTIQSITGEITFSQQTVINAALDFLIKETSDRLKNDLQE